MNFILPKFIHSKRGIMCVVAVLPVLQRVREEADRREIVGVPFNVAGFSRLHSFSRVTL